MMVCIWHAGMLLAPVGRAGWRSCFFTGPALVLQGSPWLVRPVQAPAAALLPCCHALLLKLETEPTCDLHPKTSHTIPFPPRHGRSLCDLRYGYSSHCSILLLRHTATFEHLRYVAWLLTLPPECVTTITTASTKISYFLHHECCSLGVVFFELETSLPLPFVAPSGRSKSCFLVCGFDFAVVSYASLRAIRLLAAFLLVVFRRDQPPDSFKEQLPFSTFLYCIVRPS